MLQTFRLEIIINGIKLNRRLQNLTYAYITATIAKQNRVQI